MDTHIATYDILHFADQPYHLLPFALDLYFLRPKGDLDVGVALCDQPIQEERLRFTAVVPH